MHYMLDEIGRHIRAARKLRGLSQKELALRLGMSRATISQIESGSVQEIGIRRVMRLLDSLGLELRVRQAGLLPTLEELQEEQQ